MSDIEEEYYSLYPIFFKMYGTQIETEFETIKEKLDIIVAAHLYAGDIGNNPLCKINRNLKKIMKKEAL